MVEENRFINWSDGRIPGSQASTESSRETFLGKRNRGNCCIRIRSSLLF